MKWIKYFESKTLIDKKISLLDNIFLDLYDEGFDYQIVKGSGNFQHIPIFKDDQLDRSFYPDGVSFDNRSRPIPGNLIFVVVTKQVREFSESDKKQLDDFTERLGSFGMPPRGGAGGHNFRVFYFDKWGKMTDSNLL